MRYIQLNNVFCNFYNRGYKILIDYTANAHFNCGASDVSIVREAVQQCLYHILVQWCCTDGVSQDEQRVGNLAYHWCEQTTGRPAYLVPALHICLALRAGPNPFGKQSRSACLKRSGAQAGRMMLWQFLRWARIISHGWASWPQPLIPAAPSASQLKTRGMMCICAHFPSNATCQNWLQSL